MNRKKWAFLTAAVLLAAVVLVLAAYAHGGSDGVIVRVTGYDSASHTYNFSCTVPEKTAASNIGDMKFYDIDPTPSFYPSRHNFQSADSNVTWRLDPINFEEEIHSNAMYHIYCEAQNFSAPPEKQNLASEFHIDLRTAHNQNDPNIYVLDSDGPRVTLKCDFPPGTKRYTLSWGLRDRSGITNFPQLANQRIVNITAPKASAGWDITCDVFDKDKGKTFSWDMPIEFFESGPAYVPTIEGCVAHEPCTWVHPSGVPPNGSLVVNVTLNQSPAQADIFINENFRGTTSNDGMLSIPNLIPGLYNLVIRKEGYNEISTLVPIASGKALSRSFSITENVTVDAPQCHSTLFSLPAKCNGGSITFDDAAGCRTLVCSNGNSNLKILACNKPNNFNPQYFEMYKQENNGSLALEICLEKTCIKDNGYAASQNFPICEGNITNQIANGSLRVSTIPNLVDIYIDNILAGNTGLIGSVTINNLVPGAHSVFSRKSNYSDNSSAVTIVAGEITDIQLKLGKNSSSLSNQTQQNSSQTACYSNVEKIPAKCLGGVISEDLFNGCRKLVCINSTSSMQILACDKPNSNSPINFEMYKQSLSGILVAGICIGETCIKDNGYATSANYPICVKNESTNDNQKPSQNTTQQNTTQSTQNVTVCYSNLNEIPSFCKGGMFTQDTTAGCRTLVCGNSTSSLKVTACNKPDFGKVEYFEMYRQSKTGTFVSEICLGKTCIKDNGYAKSTNYPICMNVTITSNQTQNQKPQAPQWIEPNQNSSDVDIVDFHINVFPMADADNGKHIATDFEMWDDELNERVWSSLYNTIILYHIHNADGTFENSLAGKNKLLNGRAYRLRARFYENAGINNVSDWSEWRYFMTKPQFNFTVGTSAWTAKPGYAVELVASNISTPVNIVMAPDIYDSLPESERPWFYVTQLYGQIGMIKKNGKFVQYAKDLLNYESFGSIPGSGEAGVVGLYVDDATGDLYVSLVYYDGSELKGKVDRFISNDNGTSYTNIVNILSNLPVAFSHQVQAITKGPDGKLYLNTGDADNVGQSGNISSLSGKILRFNEDGSIPSDNPFGNLVYAYGFRNPFGAAWHPTLNELYVSENGADGFDGVKRISKGSFYGWCCDTSFNGWHVWGNTTSPVGAAFNPGISGYPADDKNSLYVGLFAPTYAEGPDLRGKRIVRFTLNSDGSKKSIEDFAVYTGTGYGSVVGMAFAPDGLYFTDIFGEVGFTGVGETKGNVYRIVPGQQVITNSTNQSTEFSAGLGVGRWYPKGLDVVWECKTSGGSGNFRYDFYFGDGQKQLNSQSFSAFHTYPSEGAYHANCTARDLNTSLSTSASTAIVLGNQVQQNGTISITTNPNSAKVFINNVFKGVTDFFGKLILSVLPGNYNLAITKDNYTDYVAAVTVNSGQNASVNAVLQPSNITASLDLSIAPWYPQGKNYVFRCKATGYTPTSYDWDFGDGNKQLNSQSSDVFHAYSDSGNYVVKCVGKGAGVVKEASLSISVG